MGEGELRARVRYRARMKLRGICAALALLAVLPACLDSSALSPEKIPLRIELAEYAAAVKLSRCNGYPIDPAPDWQCLERLETHAPLARCHADAADALAACVGCCACDARADYACETAYLVALDDCGSRVWDTAGLLERCD